MRDKILISNSSFSRTAFNVAVSLFLLFFTLGNIFSQEPKDNKKFQIEIEKEHSFLVRFYPGGVKVESCIPLELYSHRLPIPEELQTQEKINKRPFPEIPLVYDESGWEDECFYFFDESHTDLLTFDMVNEMIEEMTLLKRNQFHVF